MTRLRRSASAWLSALALALPLLPSTHPQDPLLVTNKVEVCGFAVEARIGIAPQDVVRFARSGDGSNLRTYARLGINQCFEGNSRTATPLQNFLMEKGTTVNLVVVTRFGQDPFLVAEPIREERALAGPLTATVAKAGEHGLRFRTGPSLGATILQLLPDGTEVTPMCLVEGDPYPLDGTLHTRWAHVQVGGRVGFVAADYLVMQDMREVLAC